MVRFITRVFAIFAVGIGGGVLTWGVAASIMEEPLRIPEGLPFFPVASEVIGSGAGILAAGIAALIASSLGWKKKRVGPH